MKILEGHCNQIRALAFAPDGRHLAEVSGHGCVVWLRNLSAGKRSKTDLKHEKRIWALAFSPDGRYLASGDGAGCVRVFARDRGVVQTLARVNDGRCQALTFTPGGGTLAALVGPQVCLWPVAETIGTPRVWWGEGRGGAGMTCLAFSPDGGTMVIGATNGVIYLWDVRDERIVRHLAHEDTVRAAAFSPDGRTLAVAAGRVVTLWDAEIGEEKVTFSGHKKLVTGVAFAPDGRTLLSASHDGTVRLWDPDGAREPVAYDWEIGRVFVTAFAPDGMRAAAGGEGDIVIWDVDGV